MIEASLRQLIDEYKEAPIDLLGIGDAVGEYNYLVNACLSYQRTIRDVTTLFADTTVKKEKSSVKILEVGAFLGVVSLFLARLGFDVTALDIPEYMQNTRLRNRYDVGGVKCLATNLRDYKIPEEADTFDLVIMCETLEHLNFNPVPVLLEINRILKSDGRLYISLPNQASLVNRAKLLLGKSIHNPIDDFFQQLKDESNMLVGIHWREYTGSELVEFVKEVGFQIDKHYYFTTHRPSLPASLIYRLFPSTRPNQTLWATKAEEITGRFDFKRFLQYIRTG